MISSFLLLGLAFGGAGRSQGAEDSALRSFPDWEKTPYRVHFTASDLHKYLNGGAAKYLAYAIKNLYVQEYQHVNSDQLVIAELYLLDSPQNAFGIYSCDSGGKHPSGMWVEASFEGGLLQFWQGRSYVRVYPRDPSAGGSDTVLKLGAAVSEALCSPEITTPGLSRDAAESVGTTDGGEETESAPLPEIVTLMPAKGLINDSLCFFHLQVSLNSIYYLSEKNLLQLNERTDAVSAEYRTSSDRTARVITVCYPDKDEALKAYKAYCDLYFDMKVESSGPDSSASEVQGTRGERFGEPPRGHDAAIETDERWGPAGKSEWIYAGMLGRVLTLVMEAAAEDDAVGLGRTVLAATAECGHGDRTPKQEENR
jgi:hypothetical protein